ncbi:MAG TPA: Crp/Fnr family transcriptional regulator [Xanthobacteraceae bacterium]|jgi:CRP-like cAMP-binding protein
MTLQPPFPLAFPSAAASDQPRARYDNGFLSSLPAAELADLKPYLKERSLRCGECLYRPGQLIDCVIFPYSGIVSLTVPTAGGISVETAMIGREGAVGVNGGSGILHSTCNCVVRIPGSAVAISTSKFSEAMARSSHMRVLAARCETVLLLQAQQSAACNAIHGAAQRLARWLLEAHDRADGSELPITQTFLAAMIGVQRTTVTLIAGRLQKTGGIRNFRGRIQIADRAILELAACECYERIRTCTKQLAPAGEHVFLPNHSAESFRLSAGA